MNLQDAQERYARWAREFERVAYNKSIARNPQDYDDAVEYVVIQLTLAKHELDKFEEEGR